MTSDPAFVPAAIAVIVLLALVAMVAVTAAKRRSDRNQRRKNIGVSPRACPDSRGGGV